MSVFPDRVVDFLEHIEIAIERISKYTGDGKDDFLASELKQDAVIRNLEVVGEASRNIEKHFPEFVVQYPELPLRDAYRMRNFLSHGYFQVDLEVVWSTTQTNLPRLKSMVGKILSEINDG